MELVKDVGPYPFGGSCGQRYERDLRELGAEVAEFAVLWPKIMTPFRDAVSFIDSDSAQIPLFQFLYKGADEQAFGRHVEEADSSLVKVAPSSPAFVALQGGVQACGSDAIRS
jgi:hypothetical protein